MQMEHRLPGILAVVDDQPERIANAELPRHLAGCKQQVAQQSLVFQIGIGQSGNFLLRHQQHMGRRLRVDIAEGEAMLVFVDDVGWNGTADDFAEQGRHRVVTHFI